MTNPYTNRPPATFWNTGIADRLHVDPVMQPKFTIRREDKIATAGSCFAQHISRRLVRDGFGYFVTETYRSHDGTLDENYGVFPARFGNIYSSRQLIQLFDRAYGLFKPAQDYWIGKKSGEFIDPYRPRIQTHAFRSAELLLADRKRHLTAVRRMFEECDVFIFTLGLTETWRSKIDGSAYPLAPGVVAHDQHDDDAEFENLDVNEIIRDIDSFMQKLNSVNAKCRVLLTVSPVPLIATYENRHVLVSTVASKSVLRAAVEKVCATHSEVDYFPSYEIVTGPQTGGAYYEPNLRDIKPEGVDFIMSLFTRHYCGSETAEQTAVSGAIQGLPLPAEPAPQDLSLSDDDRARFTALRDIICDEEAVIKP